MPFAPPLRIYRDATAEGYEIRVRPGDGKTEEVQATPAGRGIAISRSTDTRKLDEQTYDEGQGFRRSFSMTRGSASRFVALPWDADLAHMTREERDGTLVLRIPRSPPEGGRAADPARPAAPGPTEDPGR